MSKEIELADHIHSLIYIMEDKFNNLSGVDKGTVLKSVASYYEHLITSEVMLATITNIRNNL